MTDPVGETALKTAHDEDQIDEQDREAGNGDSKHDEEDEEQSFLNPSRWWLASTAFPLLAGTFGPMASAFNICALVETWRMDIPPGLGPNVEGLGTRVEDPKW